jgi:transcription-repair coupling factor (superfamily II helicase)
MVFVASSARRADEVGRALRQFATLAEVLVLPPWDCLPYDRASPSRDVMGRRLAVLRRLGEPCEKQRFLVASVEALMLRTPPAELIQETQLCLRVGEPLDLGALQAFTGTSGYLPDDRVDEPGEIAFLGEVIDIFPAAEACPFRLNVANGIIEAIRTYDPLTQRTLEDVEVLVIGPASEVILPFGEDRPMGVEHRAASLYGALGDALERVQNAVVATDPKAFARAQAFELQVRDAHDARALYPEGDRPSPPEALYLTAEALEARLTARPTLSLEGTDVAAVPLFGQAPHPGRDFANFVNTRQQAGDRVLLAGLPHETRLLTRRLQRILDVELLTAEDFPSVARVQAGQVCVGPFDLEAGFVDPAGKLAVVAAADVFGGRVALGRVSPSAPLLAEPELRLGDVVIHEDHGIGVLRDLEKVVVAGHEHDALRLEYHGGASVLAPVEEFGKVWRYGADEDSVTLDRLNTDAWLKRRAEISRDIDRTAAELTALARKRAAATAPILKPPPGVLARFAARFPYPETPDQSAAIDAVLSDLASGRPMNRLVCGDVGFGKTEVALRAAAAAALAGKQVAVVAPTTVLARQHYETFRKRFEGTGLETGMLSRLVSAADARRVRARIATGDLRIVVGTHALAAESLAFEDLGLVIIDEEQRFGSRIKERLGDLASGLHLLKMTATPIPRTLQSALIGIEDVSVISTPPSRRRPVRTFLTPSDPATVRTALLREHRRGGQSFVVVPRIEDIDEVLPELNALTPGLKVVIAHGGLPADAVDEAMVAFGEGQGDILLATSIIESGLDVPRANTMLVWRADRFGLAQLHQLRGRVGRGRRQGFVYLFAGADDEIADATRSRLSTLEAFDRLGAGLAISLRDLDIRGGGDVTGEDQAGHLQMIGLGLYQRLLTQALRTAAGEDAAPDWTPQLNLGVTGSIPETYVPDAGVRISLYARLARLTDTDEVTRFAEEVEDRFGPPPDAVTTLMDLARVAIRAREAGVTRIDAGPRAVALTLADGSGLGSACPDDGVLKGDRLILPPLPEATVQDAEILIDRLSEPRP